MPPEFGAESARSSRRLAGSPIKIAPFRFASCFYDSKKRKGAPALRLKYPILRLMLFFRTITRALDAPPPRQSTRAVGAGGGPGGLRERPGPRQTAPDGRESVGKAVPQIFALFYRVQAEPHEHCGSLRSGGSALRHEHVSASAHNSRAAGPLYGGHGVFGNAERIVVAEDVRILAH